MTIAAGFKFDGGLLFCADTKITASVKTNQTKILTRLYGDGECATTFTYAGDVDFACAAIRSCENAIARLQIRSSLDQVERAIELALSSFYEEHVYIRPVDWETVPFRLLIGIWFDGQTRLLSSNETVLKEVEDYECVGAGDYLARYWIRQFYRSRIRDPEIDPQGLSTLEEVGLIAACALRSVTEYDESCGGEAEYMAMSNDGEFGVHVDSSMYDEFPEKLQAAMWRMLGKLTRVHEASEAYFVNEEFFNEVRELSKSYEWRFDLGQILKASVSASSSVSASASVSPSASPSASPSSGGEDEDDLDS